MEKNDFFTKVEILGILRFFPESREPSTLVDKEEVFGDFEIGTSAQET